MTSSDTSYRTLQKIWEKISRPGPNGKKRILLKNKDEIIYLYCTGFVDEKQYTVHEWVAAFEDSLQKDGSYAITEEEWIDKVRYHYAGPTDKPFDPMTLPERDWTEGQMQRLIRENILPALYFNEAEFREIFEEAKSTFYVNGIYKLTRAFKEDLKRLIDMYPSPAQVRAMGVAEAKEEKASLAAGTSSPLGTGYAAGPSPSQIAAQRLTDLLSRTGKK